MLFVNYMALGSSNLTHRERSPIIVFLLHNERLAQGCMVMLSVAMLRQCQGTRV